MSGMVKPFIHPRTAEKFQILGSDWQEQLKVDIDDDNLPIEYGGNHENYC